MKKYKAKTVKPLLARWRDVIKFRSFWDELETIILKYQREAFMSGYNSGKREIKNAIKARTLRKGHERHG